MRSIVTMAAEVKRSNFILRRGPPINSPDLRVGRRSEDGFSFVTLTRPPDVQGRQWLRTSSLWGFSECYSYIGRSGISKVSRATSFSVPQV